MNNIDTVCPDKLCAGCMACKDICPVNAVSIIDDYQWLNAVIDKNKCIECNRCHLVCQQNHPAEARKTIISYQGWAKSFARDLGSSGGLATEIMRTFIENGGIVIACRYLNGKFIFDSVEGLNDLPHFSGSKYVKSDARGAYRLVESKLKAGRRVLFVGLPCQISSLLNYIEIKGISFDRLYTIDLICHGTPSYKMLKMALREYNCNINEAMSIDFRIKGAYGLRVNGKKIVRDKVIDRYLIAFLKGGCFTDNCYSCVYAQCGRVGDLTLGDSWGTELKEELPKGVSLILVQTEKGAALIENLSVELFNVDYDNAIENNDQLRAPSLKTKEHNVLFSKLNSGHNFKRSVFAAYPSYCSKQIIKEILSIIGW